MTDLEREVVRRTYEFLRGRSLFDRRDRLVLAGIPLYESVAKDFWHTYPSCNYSADDIRGAAAVALVEAAQAAVDHTVNGDVVAYLCGAIWKQLLRLRDESPYIGPGHVTAKKLRKQNQLTGETVVSIHDSEGREVDVPKECESLVQAEAFDEILESCCDDLLDRTIVVYRRDGYQVADIASLTGYTAATIYRRLAEIEERHAALGA